MRLLILGTLVLLQSSSVLSQFDGNWVRLPEPIMQHVVTETLRLEVKPQADQRVLLVRDMIRSGHPGEIESRLQEAWLPKVDRVEWKFISNEESRFAAQKNIVYYFFQPVQRLRDGTFTIKLGFGHGCSAKGKIWSFTVNRGRVRQLKVVSEFSLGC